MDLGKLHFNQSLKTLVIKEVSTKSKTLEMIGNALQMNRTLESFTFHLNNQTGSLHPLLAGLEKNQRIKTCKIKHYTSESQPSHGKQLGDLFRNNKTLESFEAKCLDIDRDSVHEITEALRENRTLKQLKLKEIGLCTTYIRQFHKTFEKNETLELIELS